VDVNNYKTVPPGPDESDTFCREYEISAVIHTARNSVNNVNINSKSPCELKHQLLNHFAALYTLKNVNVYLA